MVRIDENKVVSYNFGTVSLRNISSYWHGDRTKLLDFTFAKFDEELHVEEKAYMSLSVEDLNIIISTLDKQGLVDWERLKKMESKND